MKTLGSAVLNVARSGNYQYATVESINSGKATVRLSSGGTRLTNLNVIGALPKVGEIVIVDYTSTTPYVRVALTAEPISTTQPLDPAPVTLPKAVSSTSLLLQGYSTTSYSGLTVSLESSASMSLGTPAYINASGYASIANASGIATAKCSAMALESIAPSGTGLFLLHGYINGGFGFTPGGYVFLSTSGGLTQAAPTASNECVVILGVALTAAILYFNPQLVVVELL